MSFSLRHDLQRCLIQRISRTVPVQDYTIDTPAYHVVDLALHLIRIGGVIADVHVARFTEP